jgi:hypothetical protein
VRPEGLGKLIKIIHIYIYILPLIIYHSASCCYVLHFGAEGSPHDSIHKHLNICSSLKIKQQMSLLDRLCGLALKRSCLQSQRSRVPFPALPEFQSSSESGAGPTRPREDNWGAIRKRTEINGRGDPLRRPRDTLLSQKLALIFADQRRSLSRYSSLADYKPRGLFFCLISHLKTTAGAKERFRGIVYTCSMPA